MKTPGASKFILASDRPFATAELTTRGLPCL